MGPERKRRGADRPLVRNYPARALGRVHSPTRPDDNGHFRQRDHEFLVVRREHARRWAAFVRLHAKSVYLADGIHYQPGRPDGFRRYATRALAKFSNIRWRAASKRSAARLEVRAPGTTSREIGRASCRAR